MIAKENVHFLISHQERFFLQALSLNLGLILSDLLYTVYLKLHGRAI